MSQPAFRRECAVVRGSRGDCADRRCGREPASVGSDESADEYRPDAFGQIADD